MILTSKRIVDEKDKGNITIDPWEFSQLGCCRYNFRIGRLISRLSGLIDSKIKNKITYEKIPIEGYVLEPGNLYLSSTFELLGSIRYCQLIYPLDSISRLGLTIDISSNFGHAGISNQWTLELREESGSDLWKNRGQIFVFDKLDIIYL